MMSALSRVMHHCQLAFDDSPFAVPCGDGRSVHLEALVALHYCKAWLLDQIPLRMTMLLTTLEYVQGICAPDVLLRHFHRCICSH